MSKSGLAVLGILFVFATAFAPLVGEDQRNFAVIFVSLLAGPLILLFRFKLGADLVWVSLMILYLILVVLLKGKMSDLTTIGYTAAFAIAYLALVGGLNAQRVNVETVLSFLRYIILFFAAVSLLQMITSLAGLPVPNQILSKGLWSYNSLAVEPSHTGRALAITMLVYLVLLRVSGHVVSIGDTLRSQKLVIVAFLISIILTGSALAILAAPLALLFSLQSRWIFALTIIAFLIWPLLYLIEVPAFQRALTFLTVLPSLDIDSILKADQSGALRVLPVFVFMEKASIVDVEFWFGSGLDTISAYMYGELFGAGNAVMSGFIPGYIIAFGLLGTALFLWTFVFRFFSATTLPMIVLWVLLFANSAWNTQLFWYGLMLLRLVYHFQNVQKQAVAVSPKPEPKGLSA